jgi:hypothetical protein
LVSAKTAIDAIVTMNAGLMLNEADRRTARCSLKISSSAKTTSGVSAGAPSTRKRNAASSPAVPRSAAEYQRSRLGKRSMLKWFLGTRDELGKKRQDHGLGSSC